MTEIHKVFDWAESSSKGYVAVGLKSTPPPLFTPPILIPPCRYPGHPSTNNASLLLFIDEADAFLRKRGVDGDGRMTEDTRNALSTFLYRTGDPTKKFMLVFSTNEPSVSRAGLRGAAVQSWRGNISGRCLLSHQSPSSQSGF